MVTLLKRKIGVIEMSAILFRTHLQVIRLGRLLPFDHGFDPSESSIGIIYLPY